MADWWPDEFAEPVGYHVTVPCSGAAYRTFDSAWAAIKVGSQVQMRHTGDSLRDPTLSTNHYGASGSCRSSTYGVAMDVTNPMRLCTQADDRPSDPTVPAPPSSTPQWGNEYCADDPFQVPWAKKSTTPRGAGTLASGELDLLEFAEWGQDGPAGPYRCSGDADCAAGFVCLKGKDLGVCAVSSSSRVKYYRGRLLILWQLIVPNGGCHKNDCAQTFKHLTHRPDVAIKHHARVL